MASQPPSIPSPEATLQDLARALHLARDSFALFIAACNDSVWRDHLISRLNTLVPEFVTAKCTAETLDPLDCVPSVLGPIRGIHLIGLEFAVPADESSLTPLRRLNLHRARWQQFSCPIILWVPEYLLGLVLRHAPDFGNWRSGSLHFASPPATFDRRIASVSPTMRTDSDSGRGAFMAAPERDARIHELTTRLQAQLPPGASVADAYQAIWCRELALLLARAGQAAQAQYWQHLALSWQSPSYLEHQAASDWLTFGDALMQGGNLAAAREAYTESETLIERLAASDPANTAWQRDLSVSLIKLGELSVTQGDLAGALHNFTTSKTIAERLVARDPGNAVGQHNLSVSLNKLGDLAVAQGDLARALQNFTEGVIIAKSLATSDPLNAAWQREVSVSLTKLGDLAIAQGDLAGALRNFTESKIIAERLVALAPAHSSWQRDLSLALVKIGDLAVAQGDLARALNSFTESNTIRQRLAASDPANAEWQFDLGISSERLGDVAVKQGNLNEAMVLHTKRKNIISALATSDPANAEWQRDLYVALEKLGNLAVAQGDLVNALRWLTESKAAITHLAVSDPTNAEWQMDLASSWNRLGQLAGQEGKVEEQLRCYDKALDIVRRLAASDPANAPWQTHYAGFLFNRAITGLRGGEGIEAEVQVNEAYGILKRLDSEGRLPPAGEGMELLDHLHEMVQQQTEVGN